MDLVVLHVADNYIPVDANAVSACVHVLVIGSCCY